MRTMPVTVQCIVLTTSMMMPLLDYMSTWVVQDTPQDTITPILKQSEFQDQELRRFTEHGNNVCVPIRNQAPTNYIFYASSEFNFSLLLVIAFWHLLALVTRARSHPVFDTD